MRGGNASSLLAISPDGTRVAYRTANPSNMTAGIINIRALDAFESRVLAAGDGGAVGPTFSPDGRTIAFANAGGLRRQSVDGGPVTTICAVGGGGLRGMAWAVDDTIYFAVGSSRGLMRVAASGGTPTRLTTTGDPTAANHFWPAALPNGRGVLFTKWSGALNRAQVAVLSLATNEIIDLVPGTSAMYWSGLLVYGARDGSLRAVPFDQDALRLTSEPTTVLDRVGIESNGAANFALSSTGTLVYTADATNRTPPRTLAWVDRTGKEEATELPPGTFVYSRLSPDGTRVALDARSNDLLGSAPDVWIWDIARKTLQRLTNDPGFNRSPTWSPDGKRVAFTAEGDGMESVHWQSFDGSGTPERLSDGTRLEGPQSFTPDGKNLIVQTPFGAPYDLRVISVGARQPSKPLLETPTSETTAEISPDGHWLAYQSDESGRSEIYVRPFPDVNASRTQVSTAGGTRPLWSRKGDELFYFVPPDTYMAVPVRLGATFDNGIPRQVLKWPHGAPSNDGRHYDVSPDGKRFLLLKDVEDSKVLEQKILVVEHWGDELKAKLAR